MRRSVLRLTSSICAGLIIITSLVFFLSIQSTITQLSESYDELNPDQRHSMLMQIPPAALVENNKIIDWNQTRLVMSLEDIKEKNISSTIKIHYLSLSPWTQAILTCLFILFGFITIQQYPGLRKRKINPKKLIAPLFIALGGMVFLFIFSIPLIAMGIPVTLWMIIWGCLCLLCFSADLFQKLLVSPSHNRKIATVALIAIGLGFTFLLTLQSRLTSFNLVDGGQFQIWIIRLLTVICIISLSIFLMKIVKSTMQNRRKRLLSILILGIILFFLFMGISGWFIGLLMALLTIISLILMDMTIDEKSINFLWLTSWLLLISIMTTILWMSAHHGQEISVVDLFNYFSLTFVGGLLLLLLVILLNTILPTIWGWRNLRIPENLLLRNKIELTTLGILFITFTTIGTVTFLLEKDRENKIIEEQLNAIQFGAHTDFILQDGFEMRRFEESDYYWDSRNSAYKNNLPPYSIFSQSSTITQPLLFGVGAYWKEKNGILVGFRPIEQSFIEAFGDSLISKLFNIYVFLFMVCLGVVYILAQSMTRPLILLGEQLDQISLGRSNPKITWNLKDEIGQLIGRYNAMLDQLDHSVQALAHTERDQAWKEMAKQVAHEIKNPLTPMRLSIQYLQMQAKGKEGVLPQQVDKTAQTLIEQIDNMTRIAENFSKFGKLPKVENEKVLLNDVVTSVHDLFRKREDMEIMCSVPIDDCFVFADKDHLIRILNNITKNAIQSIPRDRKGEIFVKLVRKEHHALVTITDNGEGIPQDRIKKVFQPNFTTKRSGTGLGLAMCSKMIESMDGQIYFETEINVGTTFFVEIPLLRIDENYRDQELVL